MDALTGFTDGAVSAWWLTSVVTLLRLLPVFLIVLWVALDLAPSFALIAWAGALSFSLAALIEPGAGTKAPEPLTLTVCLTHLAVGAVAGALLALPLLAFRWAGFLFDVQASPQPLAPAASRPLQLTYQLAAAGMFVAIDGHIRMMQVLIAFAEAPLGSGDLWRKAGPYEMVVLLKVALEGALTLALPTAILLAFLGIMMSIVQRTLNHGSVLSLGTLRTAAVALAALTTLLFAAPVLWRLSDWSAHAVLFWLR